MSFTQVAWVRRPTNNNKKVYYLLTNVKYLVCKVCFWLSKLLTSQSVTLKCVFLRSRTFELKVLNWNCWIRIRISESKKTKLQKIIWKDKFVFLTQKKEFISSSFLILIYSLRLVQKCNYSTQRIASGTKWVLLMNDLLMIKISDKKVEIFFRCSKEMLSGYFF